MKNKTEELNGHNALSKPFSPPTHHSCANSTLSDMVHVRREGGKNMEWWNKGQAQYKHVQGEEETKQDRIWIYAG